MDNGSLSSDSNSIDILIIDYKVGNHQSVANALARLGYNFRVSGNIEDILNARSYILPGVGAFAEAMNNLRQLGIVQPLQEQVIVCKKPILGICLGMQILADSSEENGFHEGLGWIKGRVLKLNSKKGFRIPHIGWNNLKIIKKDPLFIKTEEYHNFYFDHSFHFTCEDKYITALSNHGTDFVAAVQKDNIFGIQFHPEKSQNNGLKLFRSFFNHIDTLQKALSHA